MSNGGKTDYYRSEQSAKTAINQIFGSTNKEKLSAEEVYEKSGRPSRQSQRKWLQNRLLSLRTYGYVDVIKAKDGTIAALILTPKGRSALADSTSSSGLQHEADAHKQQKYRPDLKEDVTPETVLRDVKLLQKQLPSFKVIFKIEPKEEATMT